MGSHSAVSVVLLQQTLVSHAHAPVKTRFRQSIMQKKHKRKKNGKKMEKMEKRKNEEKKRKVKSRVEHYY